MARRADMATIEGEITIRRRVEDVFDYVADQTNEPRYNPAMVRAEKATRGPVGPGTRFNSAVASGGTRMRWTGRVRPKGMLRLLGPLVAWKGRSQEQRIWEGLKRHLETSNPPAERTAVCGLVEGLLRTRGRHNGGAHRCHRAPQ